MNRTTKTLIWAFIILSAMVMIAALGKRIWGGLKVKTGKGNSQGFEDPVNPSASNSNASEPIVNVPDKPIVILSSIDDVISTLHNELDKNYFCYLEDASARCRAIKAYLSLSDNDRRIGFAKFNQLHGNMLTYVKKLNYCHECPSDDGGLDLKVQLSNLIKTY